MMKKFAVMAALLLASCSGAEEAEAPAQESAAAEPAAVEMMAADGQPPEGTYELTDADGTTRTQVVSADGTYVNTLADGTTENGTWRLEAPDRWCSTLEGEEEECAVETVGEDGVWTSVSVTDPEDVTTVVRVN